LHVRDASDELVTAADAAKGLAPLRYSRTLANRAEILVQFRFRNPVVPTGGEHSLQLATVNPLLDRRIADAQDLGGITRCVELHQSCSLLAAVYSPAAGEHQQVRPS